MILYAVSDATGELALNLATAAVRQFKKEGIALLQRSRIRTLEKISRVVREVRDTHGFIIFTLVSAELREHLIRTANELQVPVVDVMGPALEALARYLQVSPSDQPGLRHEFTGDYYRRNDAIEFAVKHDDGAGLDTIDQADIILLGISRTSKTPLSIYLAYRGFKTANVPIIYNMSLPSEVRSSNPKKIVGLNISPEKLVQLRGARLARLGLSRKEDYANIDHIRQEISYANKLFLQLGSVPVIDVTSKAIEEVATEVQTVLGK